MWIILYSLGRMHGIHGKHMHINEQTWLLGNLNKSLERESCESS